MKPSLSNWSRPFLVIIMALATVVWASLPVQAAEDATFTAVEKDGARVWGGGGTVDLKAHGSGPLMIKVKNTLTAEHGFAIDSMKVKQLIKPGEEKSISVPLEHIDRTV